MEPSGPTFDEAYSYWKRTQNVLRDISVPDEVTELVPMKLLFLGLIKWRNGAFDLAARHVFEACKSENDMVMRSYAVKVIRDLCSPDIGFFDGDVDDIALLDASAAVEKLEQVMCRHPVRSSPRKTTRPSVSDSATNSATSVNAALWIHAALDDSADTDSRALHVQTLLFYAEACFMHENNGASMLQVSPVAMRNGPVYYDAWVHIASLSKTKTPPAAPAILPATSLSVLERVCVTLRGVGWRALADLARSERPWLNAAAVAARTDNFTAPMSAADMRTWFTSEAGALVPRVIAGLLSRSVLDAAAAAVADHDVASWSTPTASSPEASAGCA